MTLDFLVAVQPALLYILDMDFAPLNFGANPMSIWNHANELKEVGNSLYKACKFAHASASYSDALDLMDFEFPYPEDMIPKFQSLAVSLDLNITACCIKLGEFDSAIHMCSTVLAVCPLNVKAHFRRAIAFKHLGSPEAARNDLLKALEVEPHNKDITKELEAISLDRKGKRKVGEDLAEVTLRMDPTPLTEQTPPKNENYPSKLAKLETSNQDKMIVDSLETGSIMNSDEF